MKDTLIVTSYVVIDDVLKAWGHQDHGLAQVGDADRRGGGLVLSQPSGARAVCAERTGLSVGPVEHQPLQPTVAPTSRLAQRHPELVGRDLEWG